MTMNIGRLLILLLLTAVLTACSSKKITVEIPPQINLSTMGTVGVVGFEVESSETLPGDLTLKVVQYMQAAQPGVPILELGSQTDLLREVGYGTLDTEAVKAIGKKYGVDTLLTGTLEVTQSRPDFKLGQDLTSLSATSYLRGNFNARLRQTRTGATLWSNGAHGKWKLAGVDVSTGRIPTVDVNNTEDKYKTMLQELARVGTADFRSSYETRVVQE